MQAARIFQEEIVAPTNLSVMDGGQTTGHVTGDLESLRGIEPDDIEWLASGFAQPGVVDYLDSSTILIAAEQRIAPGGGYPMHYHRGIETVTIVLAGAYRHETDGDADVARAGDVTVVTTGTGMSHAEATLDQPLHSFMFWLRARPSAPRVARKSFGQRHGFVAVASGRGTPGAVATAADVEIYAATLVRSATAAHDLGDARGYLMTTGAIEIAGHVAPAGSRMFVSGQLHVRALEATELALVVS
jgi:quercetin 2,3-dioxygenase